MFSSWPSTTRLVIAQLLQQFRSQSAAPFVAVVVTTRSWPPDREGWVPEARPAAAKLPRPGIDAVEQVAQQHAALNSTTRRTQTRSAQRRCPDDS
jgi:hypothetical protein